MECKEIRFSSHAIQKIFERELKKNMVIATIHKGEVIAEYPDDQPYPSFLMLAFFDGIPLHVVAAFNKKEKICYVITVYVPDKNLWQNDFKTRRK